MSGTVLTTEDLVAWATEFTVPNSAPGTDSPVTVVRRGPDQWAVRRGAFVVDATGEWEPEPPDYRRDGTFAARFYTARDDALARAQKVGAPEAAASDDDPDPTAVIARAMSQRGPLTDHPARLLAARWQQGPSSALGRWAGGGPLDIPACRAEVAALFASVPFAAVPELSALSHYLGRCVRSPE